MYHNQSLSWSQTIKELYPNWNLFVPSYLHSNHRPSVSNWIKSWSALHPDHKHLQFAYFWPKARSHIYVVTAWYHKLAQLCPSCSPFLLLWSKFVKVVEVFMCFWCSKNVTWNEFIILRLRHMYCQSNPNGSWFQ